MYWNENFAQIVRNSRKAVLRSWFHFSPHDTMNDNTVKALLEMYLVEHGAPRLNNQSLSVATDYLTIFLETAIERMVKEGRNQYDEQLTSAQLIAILPQLLLDSC